jgi:hypothetical protein
MEVGNDVHEDGYVPVICGLSRTRFPDLERAWEAVRHAKRPRVHTFIATSEIHMQYKLRMSREQVRGVVACGGGDAPGGGVGLPSLHAVQAVHGVEPVMPDIPAADSVRCRCPALCR